MSVQREDILQMSVPERLALISEIWESLDAECLPLTAEECAELDRRIAEDDQNPDDGITWEAMKASLRTRK